MIDERAAESSKAELQAVLDHATNLAIFSAGANGVIKMFSKGAERLLGYRAEKVIGTRLASLFADPLAHSLDGHSSNAKLIHRDGSSIELRLTSVAVRNDAGQVASYLYLARDISVEYTARVDGNAEGNRIKNEFLARMSHEFRTPLNSLLGASELLAETSLTFEQRRYVSLFRVGSEKILKIVDELLDFSGIEAGQTKLDALPFPLWLILDDCLDLLADDARQKGLKLHLERASDVPRFVVGDAKRLQTVLLHLLGNAIKFTERGAIELIVSVLSTPHPGRRRYCFSVRDSGIGISPDNLDMIFKPFTQADDYLTRQQGGAGLGLPIARKLVQLMNGELSVQSTVHGGSTFSFTAEFADVQTGDVDQESSALDLSSLASLVDADS